MTEHSLWTRESYAVIKCVIGALERMVIWFREDILIWVPPTAEPEQRLGHRRRSQEAHWGKEEARQVCPYRMCQGASYCSGQLGLSRPGDLWELSHPGRKKWEFQPLITFSLWLRAAPGALTPWHFWLALLSMLSGQRVPANRETWGADYL